MQFIRTMVGRSKIRIERRGLELDCGCKYVDVFGDFLLFCIVVVAIMFVDLILRQDLLNSVPYLIPSFLVLNNTTIIVIQ